MPLLWLKVAVGFYIFGLIYSLAAFRRPEHIISRVVVPAMGIGLVFHFVSLVESAVLAGSSLTLFSVVDSESIFSFLMLAAFMVAYLRYRTISPGIFIFPLVFLLAFASTLGRQPVTFESPLVRSGWVVAHIALIFTGYAALFLSFAASLLYLFQERALKSKHPEGITSRLPSLQTVDDIGYKSLLLGFPFMTLGLIAGSVVAQASFGPRYFADPKVVLSLAMWVVYMLLLYTRWSSGWRGRRAAYLASFAFIAALSAWGANYFSGVHRFLAP
ncbi:MAG TPA: cytochrome c biogenesis protein CcsA [Terriglobales bacterium]|nr:cytochrome c biogenesis protein CcsA [Terriglobales bacterium]